MKAVLLFLCQAVAFGSPEGVDSSAAGVLVCSSVLRGGSVQGPAVAGGFPIGMFPGRGSAGLVGRTCKGAYAATIGDAAARGGIGIGYKAL